MLRIPAHIHSLGTIGARATALVAVGAFAAAQTPAGPHDPARNLQPIIRVPAPAPSPAPVPFCFGDAASPSACPCDNTGAAGRGCENSAFTGGAILWATGQSRIINDTLQLHVQGTLPSSLCVVLQGDSPHVAASFGDGLRCVEGNLKRLYVQNAVGGMLTIPSVNEPAIWARSNALGDWIAPGSERFYQVYYRDPTGRFCDFPLGDTFNVSNGMKVTWVK